MALVNDCRSEVSPVNISDSDSDSGVRTYWQVTYVWTAVLKLFTVSARRLQII